MHHIGSFISFFISITLSLSLVSSLKREIIVSVDGVVRRVSKTTTADSRLTEDDILEKKILLSSKSVASSVTTSQASIRKWDNGRIPYTINKVITADPEKVLAIRKAFNLLHMHTCVRFIPRTTETDFVQFINDGPSKCSSYVGKIGGMQELSVGDGCERVVGVIVHEMVHAVGFPHEQSRWDRDSFIAVQWDAIKEDMQRNFFIVSQNVYGGAGVPYDYASIMHYHKAAFSKDSRPTIITKDKSAQDLIGQREGLSACDLAKINKLYNCPVHKDDPVCDDGGVGPIPVTCVDKYPLCPLAKADPSYCDRFPGIYKRLCDQTCNGCDGPQCVDSYANKKECEKIRGDLKKCESDVMARIICPKSCGVCG